jgi:hypothetical protein
VALFAEYKFVRTEDFDFQLRRSSGLFGPTEELKLKFNLTTHLIYGGIAFHY